MKMLSLLTAAAVFSGAAVANAAEPVALTDAQLDSVTAGQVDSVMTGMMALADASALANAWGRFFAATNTETYTETRCDGSGCRASSSSTSSSAAYY